MLLVQLSELVERYLGRGPEAVELCYASGQCPVHLMPGTVGSEEPIELLIRKRFVNYTFFLDDYVHLFSLERLHKLLNAVS